MTPKWRKEKGKLESDLTDIREGTTILLFKMIYCITGCLCQISKIIGKDVRETTTKITNEFDNFEMAIF